MGNGTEGTEEATRPKPGAISQQEIEKRFLYRIANDMANKQKHAALADEFIIAAKAITAMCPTGRALSCALTALEESALWAHQAIDVHETYK